MSLVSGKPYFVYVLWSKRASRFYIGISESPDHRLQQHNQARTGWTSRFRPWVLVYSERLADYREARKREIELKSQKGGRGFFLLTGLDPARFRTRSSGGAHNPAVRDRWCRLAASTPRNQPAPSSHP
jgi:putative endonuclease